MRKGFLRGYERMLIVGMQKRGRDDRRMAVREILVRKFSLYNWRDDAVIFAV